MDNKSNTALLVMDMQAGIAGMYPDAATLIAKIDKAIVYARAHNMPVIYVVVGFREGAPEINPRNKSFAASKERLTGVNMDEWMKVHPDLAPMPGEVTVVKRRYSAFTGSDLEVVLRSQGIDHLVLTGISTSGVVLSTLREAADKDYELTVITDCCGDPDEEVHRVLTAKVFPRQATMVALDEWIAG